MKLSEGSSSKLSGYDADQGPMQLDLLDLHAPRRAASEGFVREVFDRAYGAQVTHFLPTLMTLSGIDGDVRAALGLRKANSSPLFLEVYLDAPIESLVGQAAGYPVERASIVEVGNLASIQRGALRALIAALTAYLKGAGAQWAVFTGTPTVLNAFRKLGITLHTLGPANKDRLGEAGSLWGSYYASGPMVVAGNVAEGYAALERYFALEQAVNLACVLWETAFNAGMHSRRTALAARPN